MQKNLQNFAKIEKTTWKKTTPRCRYFSSPSINSEQKRIFSLKVTGGYHLMKLINKKRQGIAPAITTLILIGVAVAAGLGAYAAYSSASSIATVKAVISIENAQLIKSTSGEEYLSVTIKNSGNKHIATTIINLQTDTNANVVGMQPFTVTPMPSAMSPGQTSSVYSRIDFSNGTAMTTHNIGDHIPVEIVATTSDGSTVRSASSVTVNLS
jgi:hypothetical protein